jgi:hypothetical protein
VLGAQIRRALRRAGGQPEPVVPLRPGGLDRRVGQAPVPGQLRGTGRGRPGAVREDPAPQAGRAGRPAAGNELPQRRLEALRRLRPPRHRLPVRRRAPAGLLRQGQPGASLVHHAAHRHPGPHALLRRRRQGPAAAVRPQGGLGVAGQGDAGGDRRGQGGDRGPPLLRDLRPGRLRRRPVLLAGHRGHRLHHLPQGRPRPAQGVLFPPGGPLRGQAAALPGCRGLGHGRERPGSPV